MNILKRWEKFSIEFEKYFKIQYDNIDNSNQTP